MSEAFGPFELDQLLGRGGMAEAYLGRYRANPDQRRYVIKRIRPDYATSEEHRRRFELEAQVLSRFRHENLVRFCEYGRVGDCYYLVMELVRGHSLHRLLDPVLDGQPPPPVTGALSLGLDISRGLAELHGVVDEAGQPRPMLHRDITPSNVIVEQGRAVLIDFGITKDLMGPNITLPGRVIGTTRYMSPEHRQAEFLDPRADVFSVGVILFEVLTGRPPWPRLNPAQELLRVRFDPPEWTAEERARIPKEVRRVVVQALACDPADRFADAQLLARALQDCAQRFGEPDGRAVVQRWVDGQGLRPDAGLSQPVVDSGLPRSAEDTVVMWNATGGLGAQPPTGAAHDVLTIPPLPPRRDAALGPPQAWAQPPKRRRWRWAVLVALVVVAAGAMTLS